MADLVGCVKCRLMMADLVGCVKCRLMMADLVGGVKCRVWQCTVRRCVCTHCVTVGKGWAILKPSIHFAVCMYVHVYTCY